MMNDNQNQKLGNNSNALQVGGDLQIYQGISYTEAKEIALDVFKNNFYQLSEEAARVAKLRAEELTDEFLKKVEKNIPESIQQMNDPGMQYALLTAQIEYAKTGDKDLEEILLEILMKRMREPNRSLKQLILNEALSIVPKITSKQLDILCHVFFIREMIISEIKDIATLKNSINAYIIPTIPYLEKEEILTNLRHLEYSSCISITYISTGESVLMDFFRKIEGIFVREQFLNFGDYAYVDEETKNRLIELPEGASLSEDLIKKYLVYLSPKMQKLFDLWDNTIFDTIRLTSTGIFLGNMRLTSKTELAVDISSLIE